MKDKVKNGLMFMIKNKIKRSSPGYGPVRNDVMVEVRVDVQGQD